MCTSLIVSGNITKDGRPLLLKHRDQRVEDNHIEYCNGTKYSFLSLVNSNYTKGGLSWCGTNNAGFSIISTATFNLGKRLSSEQSSPQIMYKALSECKDTIEFELLLSKQNVPIIPTNFGIIDAFGGAAYYEVNKFSWKKYDANDPKIAPKGYLIYTNFSHSGKPEVKPGLNRYKTAKEILEENIKDDEISPRWIINEISRTYKCVTQNIDLKYHKTEKVLIDQDFIPNYISVASIVFQGVKLNESPLNTIMWTVLGYPPLGAIVPLFVNNEIPYYMSKSEINNKSELCNLAISLKNEIFKNSPNNSNIIIVDFDKIYSSEGNGFLQKITAIENEMLDKFEFLVNAWRVTGINKKKLNDFYNAYFKKINTLYTDLKNNKRDNNKRIISFNITDITPIESIENFFSRVVLRKIINLNKFVKKDLLIRLFNNCKEKNI